MVEPQQLGRAPERRSHDRPPVDDADRRAVLVSRHRPTPPLLVRVGRIGRDPPERDLVPVEEAPQLGGLRIPAIADDDRAPRRRVGGDPLQAAGAADPMPGQPADLLGDIGRHGCDGVVVLRLDPQHARLLSGAEPDGEHGPERQRHLAEDVAGRALADDPLDSVHELDRLDPALEHGEERALAALVHRVLPRSRG